MHEWHATGQLSVPPAPFEPSRLERLAWKSGLTAEELREWLREEIEKRLSLSSLDQVDGVTSRMRLQDELHRGLDVVA